MKNVTPLIFVLLLFLLSCSNTKQEEDLLIVNMPTTDEMEDSLTVGGKEEESSVKLIIDSIVYKFSQVAAGDLQGADCYDGIMFQFCDRFSWASCYDMRTYNRLSFLKHLLSHHIIVITRISVTSFTIRMTDSHCSILVNLGTMTDAL